ncbi:unnamed protein product [Effrenium voratum]|nr:unnamed protein product [Effrenium voratum]
MLKDIFAEFDSAAGLTADRPRGRSREGDAGAGFLADLPDDLELLRSQVEHSPAESPAGEAEAEDAAEDLEDQPIAIERAEERRDVQSQQKAAWLVHLGPVRCHSTAASLQRGPWQELRAAADQ